MLRRCVSCLPFKGTQQKLSWHLFKTLLVYMSSCNVFVFSRYFSSSLSFPSPPSPPLPRLICKSEKAADNTLSALASSHQEWLYTGHAPRELSAEHLTEAVAHEDLCGSHLSIALSFASWTGHSSPGLPSFFWAARVSGCSPQVLGLADHYTLDGSCLKPAWLAQLMVAASQV